MSIEKFDKNINGIDKCTNAFRRFGNISKTLSGNIVRSEKVEKHNSRIVVRFFMNNKFINLFWRLSVGRFYQKTLCKLNIYTKYTNGRCQWCGVKH